MSDSLLRKGGYAVLYCVPPGTVVSRLGNYMGLPHNLPPSEIGNGTLFFTKLGFGVFGEI
jgi:hypothetical protein